MQVLRVMIHTTDPEMHRSTISWMWDPALVILGLVVSTPPQEDYTTVTFMTAALHHTRCVVHAAGINALALPPQEECSCYDDSSTVVYATEAAHPTRAPRDRPHVDGDMLCMTSTSVFFVVHVGVCTQP